MLLIKESQHTGNNQGALWQVEEDYNENGDSVGKIANFMGNVICSNLDDYLAENPEVKVSTCLPDNVAVK